MKKLSFILLGFILFSSSTYSFGQIVVSSFSELDQVEPLFVNSEYKGQFINSIFRSGDLAASGFESGDLITHVDSVKVDKNYTSKSLISGIKAKTIKKVSVLRMGQLKILNLNQ